MVDSDKSDNGESQTAKRLREDNSEDEKCELPSKKLRSKSPEHIESVDNKKDTPVQVTNGGAIDSEDKKDSVEVKEEHKNGKDIATDDDSEENIKLKDTGDTEMEVVEPVEKVQDEDKSEDEEEEIIKKDRVKEGDAEDEKKEIIKKEKMKKEETEDEEREDDKEEDESSVNKSKDSEVVDGLELSVECASDKEASTSESDKEKETKPRPKTIIVKAKPNDSELEVGSSEAEKSETDDKIEKIKDAKNKKKQIDKRKSTGKESSSESEQSLESNSEEDDYSPRTKKKLKKTASPPKKTKVQKAKATKATKEQESKKKPATDSEDQSESEDEEMTLADRAKKISVKNSAKKEEEKDESKSESEDEASSSNESDDTDKKNGKRAKKSNDPKDSKQIKSLRKYVTMAGLRVRYDDLWAGCKTNSQRVNRIKELLQKNGLEGRPSVQKCKKIKNRNARQQEIAELDTSNIISEGRVTRARRIEANNRANLGTPPKQREARKLLKRIQPVCDSDTE